MLIKIERLWRTSNATLGQLYIDGAFKCYTLEDVVRPNGEKVDGATAIPKGTYQVKVDHSEKFNKSLPHILDVPNFEGIRIHGGNRAIDTEGCVLVGMSKNDDMIYNCKPALNAIMGALGYGEAALQITEAWE
jgi:hypothetical protein